MSTKDRPPLPASSSDMSAPTQVSKPFLYKDINWDEIMEDLSSRFILNLPDEELLSIERICFQVEQAHWYYEDYIRTENPGYPPLPLKKFSAMLFRACPLLIRWSHDHENAFTEWLHYKTEVPVCGGIMLNSTWDKCVLVKGMKSNSPWGFPRGKINDAEPEHECAAREVFEETGYDIAPKLLKDAVISLDVKEQRITLYVIPGVPEDTVFRPQMPNEISAIEWFKLTDLPTWKRNSKTSSQYKFFAISSFIGPLKNIVNQLKRAEHDEQPRESPPHRRGGRPAPQTAAEPQENAHLSRLLTSLSLSTPSPAPAAIAPEPIPALPTPLPTPHTTASTKNDTPLAVKTPLPTDTFSSTTPPLSGDSSGGSSTHQESPSHTKSKFEFVSPFDVFTSPKVAAASASSQETPRKVATPVQSSFPSNYPRAASTQTSALSLSNFPYSSATALSPTTSFAPWSPIRAYPVAQTSPTRSQSVAQTSPSRLLQHLALLQTVAGEAQATLRAQTPQMTSARAPPLHTPPRASSMTAMTAGSPIRSSFIPGRLQNQALPMVMGNPPPPPQSNPSYHNTRRPLYSPDGIPPVQPALQMHRGQLLDLLAAPISNSNTGYVSPRYNHAGPTPSNPSVGPPIPGLSHSPPPFIVQPPPRQRPTSLLNILNQPR